MMHITKKKDKTYALTIICEEYKDAANIAKAICSDSYDMMRFAICKRCNKVFDNYFYIGHNGYCAACRKEIGEQHESSGL